MENKNELNQQEKENDDVTNQVNNTDVIDEQESLDTGVDKEETLEAGLNEEKPGKKVYRKVTGEDSSVIPEKVKEKNKQTIQDIVVGLLVLVSSYSLMFFLINQSVAWLLIIIVLILIINGVIVVRGFRRKRIILAAFGLVFIGPVVFFMLVLGACGLLLSGF